MTKDELIQVIRSRVRCCAGCTYDLTNAAEVVCPECGRNLTEDALDAAPKTDEATLTLIRLHLKRCPACGGDVTGAKTALCGHCGLDLSPHATSVGRMRRAPEDDRWQKAFGLSMTPAIIMFVLIVAEGEKLRKYNIDAPKWTSSFGPTLLLAVMVGLAALLMRQSGASRGAWITLVVLAWVVSVSLLGGQLLSRM